ncbi:MAG TPA: UDP-3-O-(3-hydroxymyristoyl)glucosamine N-acyltransferase [Gemmataceae bacterium]|jgi:UDP-3-O-[3-hydroxymyristoyl] glucosamine N-acyltransferase
MPSTVRELAALVGGELHGNGDLPIYAARALGEARPGHITFAETDRHVADLSGCPASAAVVSTTAPLNGKALIRVADPLAAFVAIARHLHGRPAPPPHGIDPLASVHPSAVIGPEASVHPFAVVGAGSVLGARCQVHSGAVVGRDCRLGDDVTLHPHAVLYDGTVVGHRVTVHAHAVLGADGFGYRLQDGRHVKVPQFGHVEVGDDVEVGACTTIDRGTFGPTRVGAGTKIDNLVMVGHNCQIGRHNILVSQVGMAGSSGTGDYVVIAGQVGVVDHVQIGAGCVIGGQAAVTKDVAPGQRMLGSPAAPERDQKKVLMCLAALPGLRKRLREVERRLGVDGGADE